MSESVFAGDAPKTDEQKTVQTIQLFFQFLAVIMALMTNLVGWFLSPEWTSWDLIGISGMMKNIWIYVSNIVYFVFAMLFVWIALMNIIGKDGDNYKLKQAIPKFIVWVLIVPFSWFIVQFVISLSSVLTVGVLSIPYNDFQADLNKQSEMKVKMCEYWYRITTNSAKEWGESQTDKFTVECNAGPSKNGVMATWAALTEQEKPLWEVLANSKHTPFGLMYFYTYSVMKIDVTDKLFSTDIAWWLTDLTGIIFKYGFAIVIFVVYALLLLALWFALFVRIIWLWMFAMLSPIFGLLYFFDKKEGAWEGAMKNFSIKELISLALVPVYVAAALSFGFLFMKVADTGFKWGVQNEKTDVIQDCFVPLGIPQFTMCWDGSYLDSAGKPVKSNENSALFKGTIGTILWQFFALIFLWIAVMAALKSSSITKEVVAPIAQFWESIGQIIQKGPANIPIIPVPDGKGGMTTLSTRWLSSAWQNIQWAIDSQSSSKWTQLWTNFADKFLKADKDIQELQKIASSNYWGSQNKVDRLKETLLATNVSKMDETNYLSQLKQNFKKSDATDEFIKWLDWNLNSDQLAQYIYNNRSKITDTQVQQFIADKNIDWIKAMLDAKSPAQQVTWATSSWSTVVKTSPITNVASNLTNNDTKQTIVRLEWWLELIKKPDWKLLDSEHMKIATHIVNQNTVWTMSEKEFKDWMKDSLKLDSNDISDITDRVMNEIKWLQTKWIITDEAKFWK